MKWLFILTIWLTLNWNPVPGAKNYRVEASHTYGKTWSNVSYGATTETRIPLPENIGLILLKLTVIDQAGDERTSAIGWWFDPTTGSPYLVTLGAQ